MSRLDHWPSHILKSVVWMLSMWAILVAFFFYFAWCGVVWTAQKIGGLKK